MSRKYMKFGALAIILAVGGYLLFSQSFTHEAKAKAKTEAKTSSAWSIRCNKEATPEQLEQKRGVCEMFQRQSMKGTGQRLIEFAISFTENQDTARGVIILPLGILLQPGVVMQIDENSPLKFDVRSCNQGGCFAHVNLNEDVLDMFKKGNEATVRVSLEGGKAANMKVPLRGFTKALNEISGKSS